jgi:hypothetical protein
MHELMADDVIGVGQGTAKRQNDPAFQRLGDAAGTFPKLPLNRVGLLEVRMRGVQDEWLASAELMAKQALETGQPSLGHTRSDVDPFTLVWVEVNVEMFGLEDLKIQLLVLNLVAAEVLCGGWSREEAGEYERRQGLSNAGIQEKAWAHHVGSPLCNPRTGDSARGR